jgi:dTDP-glucose 4,6-dehydratase
MRILVGGGAGFIGSHFTEAACKTWPSARITVLDKLTYAGVRSNLDSLKNNRRFRFVKGSINDRALARKLLRETDLLVNFAAETHVDRSLLWAGSFLETDVMGTFNLLEAARETRTVKKIVLMSTDEVYGPVMHGEAREASRLDPSSPYSASKASGDLLALAYARSFGLPVVVPRACNIYGPRQFPEKFIPLFAINALLGRPLPLYGDGKQKREWMHVSDAVRGVTAVAKRGKAGEIYNIGTADRRTNIEVARRIVRAAGAPETLIRPVKDRPGHDRRYAVTAGKLRKTGWRPLVKFPEGLASTVEWYRDHAAWWKPLLAREERYFRLQYSARRGR